MRYRPSVLGRFRRLTVACATFAAAIFAAAGCTAEPFSDAEFEPLIEAPLPVGVDGTPFPGAGPLHEVVLKTYPAHRVARADRSEGGHLFWRLFRHIQKNEVAMTAPVQMSYDAANHRRGTQWMGFYYEHGHQGTPGKDETVDVIDVPQTMVLSIGLRGPMNPEKLDAAETKLMAALLDHQHIKQSMPEQTAVDPSTLARAGDLRLMGYNSPRVPRDRQFFELQLPVVSSPDSAPNTPETASKTAPETAPENAPKNAPDRPRVERDANDPS